MTRMGTDKIRVGDLHVDPMVQRGLNEAKVRKIADSWDDDIAGFLVVSVREDGTMWVIEGQHRMEAAKLRHGLDYLVNCEIHSGLSLQDEANMFIKLNTLRSLPHAFDRFRIAVVAGRHEEKAINEAVKAAGLEVQRSADVNRVGCVEALRRVYDRVGAEGLTKVLSMATAAFGQDGSTFDADVLQAISLLLDRRPDLDQKKLIKVMRKDGRTLHTTASWKQAGQQMKKTGGSSSRGRPIARLMSEAYDAIVTDEEAIDFRLARRRSIG